MKLLGVLIVDTSTLGVHLTRVNAIAVHCGSSSVCCFCSFAYFPRCLVLHPLNRVAPMSSDAPFGNLLMPLRAVLPLLFEFVRHPGKSWQCVGNFPADCSGMRADSHDSEGNWAKLLSFNQAGFPMGCATAWDPSRQGQLKSMAICCSVVVCGWCMWCCVFCLLRCFLLLISDV